MYCNKCAKILCKVVAVCSDGPITILENFGESKIMLLMN